MCDINCIWLFNLLVAFVLIIQQQHVVVGIKQQQHHQHQHQLHQQQHHQSPYEDLTSYASALATKYLHQHSLPKVNVVKREIKNDKSSDFISYLSDFNMQDEASIPEDIFDQRHLSEIEEKERDSGLTTAGGGVVATDAVDGGDIIDANLAYDDSDADADTEPEADIILESQRSSERNFSSNDDSNKNNDYQGNRNRDGNGNVERVVDVAEVRLVDEAGGVTTDILKKTNNKKEIFKEKKQIYFGSSNSAEGENRQGYEQRQRQRQKDIKYVNNIESTPQYTYDIQEQDFTKGKIEDDNYDDGIDDEDENDDDDGSAEYERFKCMHEKKQREQQQQKEHEEQQKKQQQQLQQQQQLNWRQQQQKLQMSSMKKLNERKLNKASFNEDADHDDDDDEGDVDDDSKAGNNNHHRNNDDYDDEHQQTQMEQREQPQQQQQDAIGDIADEDNEENQNIFKGNTVENKDFPNMFIPRKMKRHNGAARLDDATNRYTRIKQQQQQQQQQPPKSQNSHEDVNAKAADDDEHDDVDDVDNQEEYMSHFRAKETNFPKSYYGIVNGNLSQTAGGDGQQEHNNGNINNGRNVSEQHGLVNSKETSTTTTVATPPVVHEGNQRQSLFEKEKSLRRNNKRYGHKTHKKKYKDYLRYSSVMMMIKQSATTTVAPALASAGTATPVAADQSTAATKPIKVDSDNVNDNMRFHKDKYDKKLKMEKLKGGIALPASPIFVLKPRDPNGQTPKPFYEGQINYYLETDDDDDALGGRGNEARFITKGDRMDTNDWYRKLSPVLRNGVKSASHNSQDDRAAASSSMAKGTHGAGVGGSVAGGGVGAGAGGYTPYHHYRSHHQRNHHHNNHHQKHHHHHSRNHAYQRKMMPKKLLVTTTPMPPPSRKHPDESVMRELGHQITDLKEFERYYAKWPHLARVQSQLHDEQLREQLELQNLQQQQLGNYQDYEYDEDYFEALQGVSGGGAGGTGGIGGSGSADENLPPYIRKYNRRNKQLLDLLEGTLPPPTRPPQQLRWSGSKLQPGPRDSSVGSMSVRIDDDYLKEKRKRYHQRQKQIHDLFEQQRATTTTTSQPPYPYVNTNKDNDNSNTSNNNNNDDEHEHNNHLPDEDVSISLETQEHDTNEQKIWQKEIGSKSSSASASTSTSSLSSPSKTGNSPIHWQMEKLLTPSPKTADGPAGLNVGTAPAPTLKSAVFKLPSYPSIAGSFIQRPRSRSAQFAPSSGSEYRRVTPGQYAPNSNSNFINAGGFVAYNGHNTGTNGKSMSARFSANDVHTTALPSVLATPNSSKNNNNQASSTLSMSSSSPSSSSSSSSSSSPASVSNSFVYHRVIDASPRLVGAGLTGRKQRLPFVAITDRRLETSKKSLTDHQKDFEQNHYPLP